MVPLARHYSYPNLRPKSSLICTPPALTVAGTQNIAQKQDVRVSPTRKIVANLQNLIIVQSVRVGSITKCLALAAVLGGFCTGCGGIATTQTFSPLMFFLPGLVEARPASPQIVPIIRTTSPAQIASNRVLAKAN
jgi:hypothetical protein